MKSIKILSINEKKHILGGFLTITNLVAGTNNHPEEGSQTSEGSTIAQTEKRTV